MIIPCPCGISFETDVDEGLNYVLCPKCGEEAEITVSIDWPTMEDEDA